MWVAAGGAGGGRQARRPRSGGRPDRPAGQTGPDRSSSSGGACLGELVGDPAAASIKPQGRLLGAVPAGRQSGSSGSQAVRHSRGQVSRSLAMESPGSLGRCQGVETARNTHTRPLHPQHTPLRVGGNVHQASGPRGLREAVPWPAAAATACSGGGCGAFGSCSCCFCGCRRLLGRVPGSCHQRVQGVATRRSSSCAAASPSRLRLLLRWLLLLLLPLLILPLLLRRPLLLLLPLRLWLRLGRLFEEAIQGVKFGLLGRRRPQALILCSGVGMLRAVAGPGLQGCRNLVIGLADLQGRAGGRRRRGQRRS